MTRTEPLTSRFSKYEDGTKSYIVAPVGLTDGDVVYAAADADIKPGNTLPVANIPVGTFIYNIELYPGKGGQLVRSAGCAAQLMAKEDGVAQVRLPSGEVRIIRLDCKATIGQVGNIEHDTVKVGKAGKTRHMRHPSYRSRFGHEPLRPPARWW